jgi:TonB-dependent receptor
MTRNIYLTITFLFFVPLFVFGQNGSLKGTVTGGKNNDPLPGANVRIDGSGRGATADGNGNYQISNLAPGSYKVKVAFVGFNGFEKAITINGNEIVTLNITLSESSEELKTVNVFGTINKETENAARATEKNANNIVNVVSAQAIEKSPDINAANVLQRVSGVTIQRNANGDDAYAIIRGLEPRYNNTLINGIQIASPDNKTRLVSLSVVPSDLLQRIEISKTLLPEMEGDAIGGTVNLIFKDAPDHRQISVTGSIGYEQIFFDRKFLDYSKADIQKYSPSELHGPTYVAQPGDFTRSNLDFRNINAAPSETFSFSYGERFFNNKLGFIIANSFQNNYFGSNNEGNDGNADPNSPDHRPRINDIINRYISTRQVLNNLITHLDYKIDDRNKIMLDNVLLYSRTEEALTTADTSITGGNGGRTIPGTGPVSGLQQSTTTNQLIENLKLSGDHLIGKHLKFDWYGAFSDAYRRIPDQAGINTNIAISYNPTTGQFTKTPSYFDSIDRIWAHNNDQDFDGAGNIAYKTSLGNTTLEVKAGGLYRHKTRYNAEDEYILRPGTNSNGGKAVFDNIYTVNWNVYNPYGAGDFNLNNYTAYENITSYYGEFKLSFPMLDIFGGIRSETTSQGFHIRQDVTNASDVNKNYTDILPSITAKYALTARTNLRLAYFASIARPAYYELVPTSPPSSGDITTKGNPGLKHTTSNNYDLRYEFYPKPDELFFVGAFYKTLTNPIELTYLGNLTYEPYNSPSATVAGAEIAYTKFFGNIGISGNYAYTHSDVKAFKIDRNNPSGPVVVEHRMLTGASVHDLNASLLYRDREAGFNAQLAFQYLGKTLVDIYPDNGDNYIQQPLSNLAFSADKSISKHFTVFTKLNNLLNTHTKVVLYNFQNGNLVTQATYLLGIRYNY